MQKTSINPSIFQEFLESASNAHAKGQASFYSPPEWARVLSIPLPRMRKIIIDLNCGTGNLLIGSSTAKNAKNTETKHRLGVDIERADGLALKAAEFIQGDVTRLYPLFKEVEFQGDMWALNPPWDLFWFLDEVRLGGLKESELPAVRAAVAVHDGRTAIGTIDSTVATLAMALDLSSVYGEGLLIANEATLQRLILGPGAPHGALEAHLWAHLVIEGNPMTGIKGAEYQESGFQTGVLYFARSHTTGLEPDAHFKVANLAEAETDCQTLSRERMDLRRGAEVRDYQYTEETPELWQAVRAEWERLKKPAAGGQFNLWLGPDGSVQTALSLFEQHSSRVDKTAAAVLFDLNGKKPMQLVMLKAQRRLLEEAAGLHGPSPWRVDPKLQDAVRRAVGDYQAVRAPLTKLSAICSLGWLDEEDEILCEKDVRLGGLGAAIYRAGSRYALRTMTANVTRDTQRMNLAGEQEDISYSGSELAFLIMDETHKERCFMEGRLRSDKVTVSGVAKEGWPEDRGKARPKLIDFTLQELVGHFHVPEVPDVASLKPEEYRENLRRLEELEIAVNC